MNSLTKTLSAGFLTVAVIGGVGAYLAHSLTSPQAQVTAVGYAIEPTAQASQPVEVVTVMGTRRAS